MFIMIYNLLIKSMIWVSCNSITVSRRGITSSLFESCQVVMREANNSQAPPLQA